MSVIIPRWEFRTFGARFGAAEEAFAAMTPGAVQETDELYLLTRGDGPTADVVKVRFDLMDVKALREVSPAGLERWEPVAKVAFPLAAADLAIVTKALHLPSTPSEKAAASLEGFLAEVVRPDGAVRAVKVHKRRVRYSVGGCTSEVSDVTADGRPIRTIAIEAEDPAAVVAAVRSVGLGDYVNTSYPVGLAALLDGRPPRYAVIDVGTNSVKFHVGERLDDGTWRAVADRAEITRMGEGLGSGGTVAPAALERTIEAIAGMADEAKRQGAVAIAAVGTAWLRAATDRDDVLNGHPRAHGRQRRGDQRRGRGTACLCRSLGRTRDRRRRRRRVRHGGRQHAVHLRSRRSRRGALQPAARRRGVHGAVRPDRGHRRRRPWTRSSRRWPRTSRVSTAGLRPTPSLGWAVP